MLHVARWKYRTQKLAKKSPSGAPSHNFVGLYLRKYGAYRQSEKLLSNNISSTCPHNMVHFGSLAAEIGPVEWGTPPNFNGFHVLATLLTARHFCSGRQPYFAALNRECHQYSAGRASRWASAQILFLKNFFRPPNFWRPWANFRETLPHDAVCPEIVYLL